VRLGPYYDRAYFRVSPARESAVYRQRGDLDLALVREAVLHVVLIDNQRLFVILAGI
jgi:hypothetical protein